MAYLAACLGFIWPSISGTLEDFMQRGAREALTFAFNWIVQKVRGTDSRELLANFPHGVVGAEEPLSRTRRLLEEDDSTIIGIYGMGGVGKTTLLKTIHDEYLPTRSELFDIVIFVTVSKVILVDSIQRQIGKKLGFEDNFGEDTTDRSTKLFNELRKKKFLLLLDDLWEKLDLAVVGIPHADYLKIGSKVVFTTRSIRVCNVMDASHSKVQVPSLSPEKSWELFCKSLGKIDAQWNDSTRTLAEAVAEKCGGLPLALITVGRAMANAITEWEWEHALEASRDLEEVKEDVLPSLMFSYDRLKDEDHKECLLYCSLFPEDHSIMVDQLIEYWIGEGLLGSDYCSLDKARKRGLNAINVLKSVCLLEKAYGENSDVKLHDMVREMALWITSGKCRTEKITFLVNSGEKLERAPISNLWADATKVSLMYNNIKELPKRPECHNLRTLLMNENRHLRHIPCEFLLSMPLLTILDLSFSEIELLPLEIGLLLNLRFLNLSYTPIKSLPLEVGRLKKLTILKLRRTDRLEKIPKEAITLLSSIRLLNIDRTRYEWRGGWKGDHGETGVCFRDLDSLKQLEELYLGIGIYSQEDFCGLLNSRKLWSVVRDLYLEGLSTSCIDWSSDFEDPKELRELYITGCFKLEQMIFSSNKIRKLAALYLIHLPLKMIYLSNVQGGACFENLWTLWIEGCKSLEQITWVKDLPRLWKLVLKECIEMEGIIKVEEADVNGMVNKKDSYFPRLLHIELHNMPNLKTICKQVLLFPCLEYIMVSRCPNLKKLPFGSDSAERVTTIGGEPLWWDGLEWDNQHIRSKFYSHFHPYDEC